MSSAHLFEFRPASPEGVACASGRCVLVVALGETDASQAILRALRPGDEQLPAVEWFELNDLGPHDGPEEPGTVFVNGYRIAV